MKKYFLLFIFLNLSGLAYTQSKADSLLNILKTSQQDTSKINTLNELSRELWQTSDYEKGLQYANDALTLSDKLLVDRALSHLKSLLLTKKATAYINIGNIYKEQGNYPEALKNYFVSLKIGEEITDKKGMAYSYNNIGLIYWRQGNYTEALKNYFACLKIMEEIGGKKGMAASYNNIGLIYDEQSIAANSPMREQLQAEALKNYFASLKIREEMGDKQGIAASYNNIGSVYDVQGIYGKALENYFASLKIKEEIGDKQGITACYINIGTLFISQKKFSEAKEYLVKALALSKEIGHKEWIKESYRDLSDLYSKQGNWKEAYQYHKLFSEMKDTILNEESSEQIAEMQTKYETEKKEQQITLLNKDKELQDAQLNRQKIIIWSVAGGLLVVLILSVFIFRERRKSEKLLLNILPAETARELKRNGKATARHYESVTVMFTDFKGFTSIAEKLSAEELVSELDFLFKKFDEIISKYNIEKIKTIGDAYMCASGLPTPNNNHGENIVKASLEIQQWMTNQNNKWQVRIGIHSGPVTAGVVGDKKFAYDIWGDTVNIASRMESSGEAGKINISGATHELIKDKFKCEFRGKIPAKNKGDIEMYFLEKNENA